MQNHDFGIGESVSINFTTCVRIGFGRIAEIHKEKLRAFGVKTIGVLENSPGRRRAAASQGFPVLSSYREAADLAPDFWDICSPTSTHLEVLGRIIESDINTNVLIEKPICTVSRMDDLQRLLRGFQGKIVVNENYSASEVTDMVRAQVRRLALRPSRVVSEMTKNRTEDFLGGRFLDREHYAFGYEGPHMIANVLGLGDDFLPQVFSCQFYDDIWIRGNEHSNDHSNDVVSLFRQGATEKRYTAQNGALVILYTAMDGHVGYYYPGPHPTAHIPPHDTQTRYRILAVEDSAREVSVVGFYEPIPGFERNIGQVVILEKGKIKEEIHNIHDDTMSRSLQGALAFFHGKRDNPYSVSQALDNLEMLELWEDEAESGIDRGDSDV
uniref:Oxidoreductase family, NAD-binding Rossmann fold n=1 Tax=Candidatus Kentrum sp. LPFa TaxID=2126335 RepID=A0A450W701_9GAMM|nr:MAG: Oxidoreductase family, NAD-binding Rossmann fold [Candidatus Kentron sp. LPFa]